MAVEGQRLAHRRGGAAISPLPERVADVDRAGASLTIVFTRDQPSEHRPNAQGVEKLSAGPNDIRHVHFAAFGEIEPLARSASPGCDGRKDLLPLLHLLPQWKRELGVGSIEIARAPMLLINVHDGQTIGIVDGEGAEANGVDQSEDGSVGADAQGEGENGDHGEAGRLDQNAQAVPNVLNQVSHGRLTSQDT